MIDVVCKCGKRYRVAREQAHKRLRCGACQAIVVLPSHGELRPDITFDAPRATNAPPQSARNTIGHSVTRDSKLDSNSPCPVDELTSAVTSSDSAQGGCAESSIATVLVELVDEPCLDNLSSLATLAVSDSNSGITPPPIQRPSVQGLRTIDANVAAVPRTKVAAMSQNVTSPHGRRNSWWSSIILPSIVAVTVGVPPVIASSFGFRTETRVTKTFSPIGEQLSVTGSGRMSWLGIPLVESTDLRTFSARVIAAELGVSAVVFLLSGGCAFLAAWWALTDHARPVGT